MADFTLDKSFKEIENYFTFYQFPKSIFQEPSYDNIIQIWTKIIDVQQHFNDIALRIRNIALTVFTFIIGGIGYTTKDNLSIIISDNVVPYSTVLAALGIVIVSAFFYMDRFWYHNLRVGSVKQGAMIEKKWGNIIPELNLTCAIGKESPHNFLFFWKIHSKHKFLIFYGILAGSLSIIFFLTL